MRVIPIRSGGKIWRLSNIISVAFALDAAFFYNRLTFENFMDRYFLFFMRTAGQVTALQTLSQRIGTSNPPSQSESDVILLLTANRLPQSVTNPQPEDPSAGGPRIELVGTTYYWFESATPFDAGLVEVHNIVADQVQPGVGQLTVSQWGQAYDSILARYTLMRQLFTASS